MDEPEPIEPDTKDWTVVITEGCDECGFVAGYDVRTTGERLRATVPLWRERLSGEDVRERPEPSTWSPLEYGAHCRDVLTVMRGRLELMLAEDGARFASWDQDAAAVDEAYWQQDPEQVADEYAEEAALTAEAFDAVGGEQWDRRGSRAGTAFTVATLAVYLLHDLEHHLVDVGVTG
ncbi:DinB family protein [Ornithinimicrobium tianjinense]|uniref:Methyltransferase type 12 n=1 Tax=Ornithinimicrobium tianjinense TaxID=1195761 RepID=A0A917F7W5_9MICO|nr:DinB family protein [Ornithinimicrobium tianjinense]GGF51999.1 methyltransferase type 12 [Ornithinimicrobium tianjinense]